MLRTLTFIVLLSVSWSIYAGNITGRVVKVYDGDTITILDANNNQHRIRLQGIDAPERGRAYGRKSGDYLAEVVAGETVTVKYSKRYRYKRVVGCFWTPRI